MRGVPSSRETGRRFLWRRRAWAWRCARGRRRTRRTSFHATKRAASDTTAPSGGQIHRSMHALLARSAPTSRRYRRKRRRSPNFLPVALLCGSARSSASTRQSVHPATQSRPQAPKTVARCTLCRKEALAARASPPAPPAESRKKRTTGAAACVTIRQLHRRPDSEVMP